jgi:hypothetical protein
LKEIAAESWFVKLIFLRYFSLFVGKMAPACTEYVYPNVIALQIPKDATLSFISTSVIALLCCLVFSFLFLTSHVLLLTFLKCSLIFRCRPNPMQSNCVETKMIRIATSKFFPPVSFASLFFFTSNGVLHPLGARLHVGRLVLFFLFFLKSHVLLAAGRRQLARVRCSLSLISALHMKGSKVFHMKCIPLPCPLNYCNLHF